MNVLIHDFDDAFFAAAELDVAAAAFTCDKAMM